MSDFEMAVVIILVLMLLAGSGMGRKQGRYVRGPGKGPPQPPGTSKP